MPRKKAHNSSFINRDASGAFTKAVSIEPEPAEYTGLLSDLPLEEEYNLDYQGDDEWKELTDSSDSEPEPEPDPSIPRPVYPPPQTRLERRARRRTEVVHEE